MKSYLNNKYVYLALAVISLIIGLMGGPVVEGAFKGLAGVFFILFYIFLLLQKQPTDETTRH